jgi:hypothetical protein
MPGPLAAGLVAGAVAGAVSGVPSTLLSLGRPDGIVAATRAAGALLGRPTVPRGILAHAALSLGWGVILSKTLPRHHRVSAGLVAGAAIAALDLGLVGRRTPEIRALPQVPQWLDHLAYGASAGAVLAMLDCRGTVGATGHCGTDPHGT